MAAYAALVSLFNDLELIPTHPTHSFSFEHKQLSSLSQIVEFLIDFMETYDSHGCTRGAVEALESRIASAAHAAHDVIESHVVDQIHAGSTLVGGRKRSYFLLDLQRAIEGMEFVKRKAMRFPAKSGLKAEQPRYSSAAPSTSSTEPLLTGNKKNAMVEFDSVLVQLLHILTGEPSNQRLVIPIVGMGGIGKTTLARNAYDHSFIQEHFDLLLWATISLDFSIQTILMELLFGVRNSTSSGGVGELGDGLHKKLWGRRYLVVLDDMWSVDAWDVIQMYLPDNGNGSRVIVTTRLSNLATTHLSSSPFEMKFLGEGKSWELFCEKAFGGGKEDCPAELEEIGKKIVRRCRGLPLSIIVVGGHLRKSPRAIEYWEKLSNSINPISSLGRDDQCLEILRLSYQHLPACLKPCFLYFGVYPEDHRINVPQLLRYWVCEGFIKPKRGLIDLEEAAEDYLEDLIDRNLVLVRTRRWNGKVEACAIHDVVRELCLKVGKKEKFISVVEDTTGAKGCKERRIVVPAELSSARQHRAGGLELPLLLRSLVCQGSWYLDELSVDFRLLRVSAIIDLDWAMLFENYMYWYCPSNFQQVNIRHLVFYVPSVKLPYCIPSSISLLWNLQKLTLMNGFGGEISAPSEIWKVPQIRHLQFGRLCLPDPLPSDGSNQEECIVLRNLHTLIGVVDLKLTEEVCKRIPNIKKLRLKYYTLPAGDQGKEASSSYYCLHNLGRLNKLESLKCYFGFESKWRDLIQSLAFPSSLVELTLSYCHWEDLTKMIKSIPQLKYLHLLHVLGSEWELAEEEFPHLRILKIISPYGLINWNASSYNFPVLEELHIYSSELSEIPFDLGEIPTLRLIHLTNCSLSCALSAMRIAAEQENLGNQDLQLKVIFGEMEGVERFQEMAEEEGLSSENLSLYHMGDYSAYGGCLVDKMR